MRILVALVSLSLLCGPAAASPEARADTVPTAGGFHAIRQVRVLEATQGSTMPAHSTRRLSLTSRVPTDATAVVVNLTVVAPRYHGGFLTLWPDGTPRPLTSNVNFARAQTVANLAVVPLRGGAIDLYNGSDGLTGVIVDLSGYYSGTGVAGGFTPGPPTRVLDTRRALGTTRLAGASTHTVQIGGRGGVPVGAAAVVIDLAVTGASRDGYLSAWPAGSGRPQTSAVVFAARHDVATLAIVPLDTSGRLELYDGSAAAVDVVGDVTGYFLRQPGPSPSDGSYVPLRPARLLDTRRSSPAGPDTQRDLPVAGRAGLPTADVAAVVVTVTATRPGSTGYLKAWGWPDRPTTSVLNFVRGATVANTAVLPLCAGGVSLFNQSPGATDLLVDVVGYVAGPPPPCWRDATPPTAPGTASQEIFAVSCPAGGTCTTVGWRGTAGGGAAYAQQRSAGGAWSAPTAIPSPELGIVFAGLSCVSSTTCVGIGTDSGRPAAAELANGIWTSTLLPVPTGPRDSTVSGVSCPATGRCLAVGTSGAMPAVWTDTDGLWTLQILDRSASLAAISCAGASHCVAVGHDETSGHSLVVTLTGGSPTFENLAMDARLTHVSCPAVDECTAVGDRGLARLRDGAWGVGGPAAGNAISCAAPGHCTVVAFGGPNETYMFPLVAGVVGTSQLLTPVSGEQFAALVDVSCAAADRCLAVGRRENPSATAQPWVEIFAAGPQ